MPTNTYHCIINRITGSDPSDGFIDNIPIETYLSTKWPSTYLESVAKERANSRFRYIIESLQLLGNIYISNIVNVGGDSSTTPTSISFDLTVEHGEGSIYTIDENNTNVYLIGMPAMKRAVARALMISREEFGDIFDPLESITIGGISQSFDTTLSAPSAPNAIDTSNTINLQSVGGTRYGIRTVRMNVGPLVNNLTTGESYITITKLS